MIQILWLAILALAAGPNGRAPVPDRPRPRAQALVVAGPTVAIDPSSRPKAVARRWEGGPFGMPTPGLIVEDCDDQEFEETWWPAFECLTVGAGPWPAWDRPDSSSHPADPRHQLTPSLTRVPLRC